MGPALLPKTAEQESICHILLIRSLSFQFMQLVILLCVCKWRAGIYAYQKQEMCNIAHTPLCTRHQLHWVWVIDGKLLGTRSLWARL